VGRVDRDIVKRFLITTANERTWRRDRPVLFLGEWCRLYNRRAAWEHLDAEVVPYHWDDRARYHADCDRLRSLYEELLCRTVATLNAYHGTDRSTRYWRILVGPWLYMFTHVLFDRWTMVQLASDYYEIDGTRICEYPAARTIPADLRAATYDDVAWSQHLFGRAIEWQDRIPRERIPAAAGESMMPAYSPRRPARGSTSAALRGFAASFLAQFRWRSEVMIIHSYLPPLEELKLQLMLGQVPKRWRAPQLDAVAPDLARRRDFEVPSDSTDAFFRFAAAMVSEQIPTVFLEGYRALTRAAERLAWPSRPKAIFTSNLFQYCEVFQAWAAAKVEQGSLLVIGQHGGLLGVGKHVSGEDHQVAISDRYLTWGWRDHRPQTHAAVILTNVNKRHATWNPAGNLLLVTVPVRLLTFRGMSWPVGSNQSACFVEDQIRFAATLDESVRARLTVRIDEALDKKLQTFFVDRWKDALPDVQVDPSVEPLERSLRQCRLFVYTYNSTGFLETLGRNIPTIMFWNPWYFELRPSAQPYFDLLAQARIYHETPELAAQHVTAIWNDVAGWWNEPVVQRARRAFCEQYARMPANPLRVLKDALLTAPARADVQEAVS